MSDYSTIMNNPYKYQGSIQLFFDENGNFAWQGNAKIILTWRNTKTGIRYTR